MEHISFREAVVNDLTLCLFLFINNVVLFIVFVTAFYFLDFRLAMRTRSDWNQRRRRYGEFRGFSFPFQFQFWFFCLID
jgi:hypothetical protein